MPRSVDKVKILRSSRDGLWYHLSIIDEISSDGEVIVNDGNTNIDDAIILVAIQFIRRFGSKYPQNINLDKLKCDIIQGFHQMGEISLNIDICCTKLIFLHEKQPEPHFSCKTNENVDSAIQASGENEISQSEVQQKLSVVDKDSEIMKFFEENKCSVCLTSYREILDDNLHIVIPSCGHPLCCEYADNILRSTKKECPRCRVNITVDSFNLMKFNGDSEMKNQDQRVFL